MSKYHLKIQKMQTNEFEKFRRSGTLKVSVQSNTLHVSPSVSGKYGTCIYSELVILQFMCVGSANRMLSLAVYGFSFMYF